MKLNLAYIFCLIFFMNSCKTKDIRFLEPNLDTMNSRKIINANTKEKYEIINEFLNEFKLKNFNDSITLDPLTNISMVDDNAFYLIKNSNLFNKCKDINRQDLFNQKNLYYFDSQLNNGNILLSKDLIENDYVTLGFKLKSKKIREEYKQNLEKYLYLNTDRNYVLQMYWLRENLGIRKKQRLLQITPPLFNKEKNIAIIFSKALIHGRQSWVFEKKDDKWKLLCKSKLTY